MIEQVSFQGYKLLRDVTLKLSQLTVLVGPNACGKSSVLEGVESALRVGAPVDGEQQSPYGRLGALFADSLAPDRLHSRPGAATFQIGIQLQDSRRWRLRSRRSRQDDQPRALVILESDTHVDGQPDQWHQVDWASGNYSGPPPRVEGLPSPARKHLHAAVMAEAAYAREVPPRLGPDGSGLAPVLRHLHSLQDGRFEAIREGLRRIVPAVRGIRALDEQVKQMELVPVNIRNQVTLIREERVVVGARLELQVDPAGWVQADQLSEGTLLALGLLTAIHEISGDRVLLLDDLDKGLHPAAQIKLVEVLREILSENPDLQILATAHSPMLLAGLKDEEIIRLDLDDAGFAQVLPHEGGAPGWMTGSELLDQYFGVHRPALSAKVQRLALLAGDPARTDEEEQEIAELQRVLAEAGLQTRFEVVPRGLG